MNTFPKQTLPGDDSAIYQSGADSPIILPSRADKRSFTAARDVTFRWDIRPIGPMSPINP